MQKIDWTRTACLCLLLGSLGGCLAATEPEKPVMYEQLNRSNGTVSPGEALGMINSYRQNNGLRPVTLDSRLIQAAKIQAQAMAAADKVSHALKPSLTLSKRLSQTGYGQDKAVENISAGYWTLAEAFSGWRDSKLHNANMLNKDATQMGIATHFNPDAKYQVFWSLILAKPKPIPIAKTKPAKPSRQPATTEPQRPNHKTDSLAELFGN